MPRSFTLFQSVAAQISLYGLTTAPVVRRSIMGGRRNRTRQFLVHMCDTGRLFRHVLESAAPNPIVYYTRNAAALPPRRAAQRLALLNFSVRGAPPHPTLLSRELPPLLATLAPARSRLCQDIVALPHNDRPRLGLVRSYLHPSQHLRLNRLIAAIDRFVNGPSFQMWWDVVAMDRLTLVVLVPGMDQSQELGRWLARRPPVARRVPALVVPTLVAEARLA